MIEWINANEPLWLFLLIGAELVVGLYTAILLTLEYFYDKSYNEKRNRRKKTTRNKVKVEIDRDGNARISESPKDIDVSISHLGKD